MHDDFERRVMAAAIAAWWVVLFDVLLVTLSWIAYLVAMSTRPAFLLSLWGPELSWEFVQTVWFCAVVAFKIIAWSMVMVALWLTLWARQLRKSAGRP